MNTATGAAWLLNFLKAERKSKPETVRQLAEYCLGWPYVWASNGEMCTPEWRKNRIPYCNEQKYADAIWDNCPVLSGKQPACDGCKWVDTRCFDCQGFVHWLMEQAGVPLYGAGATTQWNTASNWAAKGEINTMPKGLVCAIYKRKDDKMSHTGLSMGDGAGGAIHCSTTVKRGNVNADRPAWTHWGIPKGLYSAEELKAAGIEVREDDNMPTLRRGNQGEAVEEMQALLNAKYGYNLEVDGNFGKATEAAVKDFQKKHGLTADGVVGAKTWKAMGIATDNNVPTKNPADDSETPQPIDRYRYTWDTLLAAIKNPYGVAGLMGNLQAESGINPENLQNTGERAMGMTDRQYTKAVDDGSYTNFADDGYGYGIAQWTYKTRKSALLKYAKEHKQSIGDLEMQLGYLLDELRFDYPRVWYTLQNATSVREASDAVLLDYERPKNQAEENQARRAELGQKFYDEYAQISPSEPPVVKPEETIAGDVKIALRAAYANAKMACDILHKLIEGE